MVCASACGLALALSHAPLSVSVAPPGSDSPEMAHDRIKLLLIGSLYPLARCSLARVATVLAPPVLPAPLVPPVLAYHSAISATSATSGCSCAVRSFQVADA